MRQIYVNSAGLSDWQARLAKPDIQWQPGHSAYELAVSWEEAADNKDGLPECVARVLYQRDDFKDASVLFAIPEHKVPVPGHGFDSQTDLWALLKGPTSFISLAVEGKAGEDFGPTIEQWREKAKSDKAIANHEDRLTGLCTEIGCPYPPPTDLRYQLFHRTASAVIEAKRCSANIAVMLVQSFGVKDHFADFANFASHLGTSATKDTLSFAGQVGNVRLFLGWVNCSPATDSE